MKYITLGKTDLTVSHIAFGTRRLGGEWGRSDAESAGASN